jgi:hypothetical protein
VERALEPADVGIEPTLQRRRLDQAPAVGLGAEHVDELAPPRHELRQPPGLRIGDGAHGRPHRRGKCGNGVRLERVRFGELAGGAGKFLDLAGIDDDDGQGRGRQRGRHDDLVSPGGFQCDQRRPDGLQPARQVGQAGLVAGDGERVT